MRGSVKGELSGTLSGGAAAKAEGELSGPKYLGKDCQWKMSEGWKGGRRAKKALWGRLGELWVSDLNCSPKCPL